MTGHEQKIAPVTSIESPAELTQPYEMGHNETLIVKNFGVDGGQRETRTLNANGMVLEGVPSLSINVGGENVKAKLELFDCSDNPKADVVAPGETKPRHVRIIGRQNGQPIEAPSNFALVLSDENGEPRQIMPLLPNEEYPVGREQGRIGSGILPDTASRNHLEFKLDAEGNFVVINGQPTNKTVIEKSNIYPKQIEHKRQAKDLVVSLGEVLPLSDQEETAKKLGIVGEVIASLDESRLAGTEMNSGVLFTRRINENGDYIYGAVQRNSDGGVTQQPLSTEQGIAVESFDERGEHQPGTVSIDINHQLKVDVSDHDGFSRSLAHLKYVLPDNPRYVERTCLQPEPKPRPRLPKPDSEMEAALPIPR